MHPYENLDEKYFWSSAVAKKNMFDIEGLWNPKFAIRKRDRVVTFGSCFAQHIGRAMAARGYNWVDTEPAPEGLSAENAKKFNYGIFSSRTGNIYTVSLLRQWTAWALGKAAAPDEIWEDDKGRFHDPFRPVVEPGGFASRDELLRSRQHTIDAFRKGIETASVFVFTLGLTESWHNDAGDFEYPMCPGTAAGTFDPALHKFHNQRYPLIRKELMAAMDMMREVNPGIRFLLTVSPVPLTATMSGNHVLVATMESKSTLRAVAGHLAATMDDVDYFPSYEIINATPFRGTFFEANQRNVNHAGVNHVMDNFFACLNAAYPEVAAPPEPAGQGRRGKRRAARADAEAEDGTSEDKGNDDVVCEEALLGAFGKK